MSQIRCLLVILLTIVALGCGGSDEGKTSPKTGAAARPSGKGACSLLMQGEIDAIFGTPVGAGTSESLDEGTELCSWPSGEDPAFLLQVGPAADDVNAAVDLGEGYRVEPLPGMSGPAAMAIEASSGEENASESVALLALTASNKTVTLSPIGLGVQRGTDQFERLKEMVELVAGRL